MRRSEKIIYTLFGTLLFLSLVTSISYALWSVTRTQEDPSIVTTGCFELEFIGGTALDLSGEFPITDAEGLAKDPYHFTIKNICSTAASVNIKLLMTNETTMGLNHIKTALNGGTTVAPRLLSTFENGTTETANISSAKILGQTYIPGNATQEFDLRVWMDESVTKEEEQHTKFAAKIEIEGAATNPLPACSFAANVIQPKLDNGLIPVVYEDNKWKKADMSTEWFDYCNQIWANAVTVKEANRSTYVSAVAGTEISMDAINTMWVWIPRYEYKKDGLWSNYAGGTKLEPGTIQVNFISKETTTPSADNFLIHPAFTFGEEELSGMWVAKFEMSSGDTTCTPTMYSEGTECDLPTIKPSIVPNTTSWRGARVGTFWTAIHDQMNGSAGTTTYGIKNSDTHMIKNMEWGAVAYLSQSQYGKRGNASYTGINKEIYQNKSADYITGNSNGTPGQSGSNTQVAYNVEGTGTGASTTGNIYGIYDMSGGAYEYVMGVMKESTNSEVSIGNDTIRNSGFSGKTTRGNDAEGIYGYLKDIDTKYYDVYDYGTSYDDGVAIRRGKVGDATKEVTGWYQDSFIFVNNGYSFFNRGGTFKNYQDAGVFSLYVHNGVATEGHSSRPVLVSSAS